MGDGAVVDSPRGFRVRDRLIRAAERHQGTDAPLSIDPPGRRILLEQREELLMAPSTEERTQARDGAVEVAAPLWIRTPRQLDDRHEPICPRRGGLGRHAEAAPKVAEPLDVGDLVGGVGVPQTFEPPGARRPVGWRPGDDGDELLDRAVPRA
jgi:hypothetical protein